MYSWLLVYMGSIFLLPTPQTAEDHAEIFMPTLISPLTSRGASHILLTSHALVVPKYTCLFPAPACYAVLYKTTTGPTYFHISETSSVPLHSHVSWVSSPANLIFWISLGNKSPSPFQQTLLLARPWYFLPLQWISILGTPESVTPWQSEEVGLFVPFKSWG